MSSILERVKANAERKGNVKPSETIDVVILDIRPTRQVVNINGVELKKVQVITKDHGSFFPFENAISNPVSSFGDGIKAKMTLQENNYKNSAGEDVKGLNCTRVVIEAVSSEKEAMIKALPKGAALFAM